MAFTSLRQPLKTSFPSLVRPIASSSRSFAPPAPASTSEPSFEELYATLKPSTSSSSTSASAYPPPSAHTPQRADAVLGYAPEALPPAVDPILDIFTNMLMKHGKKAEAQRQVTDILQMLQKTANAPPQPLLAKAITLSSPFIRINSTRRRAKVVQTPKALDERQRTRQGIVWLLKAAERGRKAGLPRDQRIAREVFAVLEGQSDVFKWVEERHRLGTANRSNLNVR